MRNLKFLIVFALITLSLESFAQLGITSYSIYALGINTSQNRRISAELKTFANREFKYLNLELDAFYNFKPGTYHRFSIGVGINVMPFREFDRIYSLNVPLALEIYPLQEFKKISLLFELTPEILPEDGLSLRSLWGIRYTFGK